MASQTVFSLSGGELGKKRGVREWTVVKQERSEERASWPLIKRGFTEAQRKELEVQAVIYRHITAGLPVPLHLVLPIWKSVATSLGPSYPTIYKHYPSFIGFILQGFDCRNVMDPEPGRCRRTDGKKWRCRRDVLSDQKYCERHIHRGRQRSRKHVEASEFASFSRVTTKPEKPKGESTQNPNSNLSVSVGLQLMTPSSIDPVASHRNTNLSMANAFSEKRMGCVSSPSIAAGTSGVTVNSAVAMTSATNSTAKTVFTNCKPNQSISAAVTTSFTSKKTNQNAPKDASEKRFGHNRIIQGGSHNNNSKNSIILARNVPTVLGFSPRSVLHVAGHHRLYIGNQTSVELEPGRCRRTDGKKWRCRRDVVPHQKYCPRHMHRGAKKLVKAFEPTQASSSATNTTAPSRPATESLATPNTNLCISFPTSPSPISNDDEKSISSTSSDTTLSDTSISAFVVSKTTS